MLSIHVLDVSAHWSTQPALIQGTNEVLFPMNVSISRIVTVLCFHLNILGRAGHNSAVTHLELQMYTLLNLLAGEVNGRGWLSFRSSSLVGAVVCAFPVPAWKFHYISKNLVSLGTFIHL